MYQKNQVSLFRGAYEQLYQMGFQTISLLLRDLQEFETVGIGQQNVDEYIITVNEFNAIVRDEVYLGEQMLITEEKNQLVELIRSALRSIMLKVEAASSVSSIIYIQFRNGNISQMTDIEISDRIRTTIDLLKKWFDKISPFGLTQTIIDQLIELQVLFNLKQRQLTNSKNDRDCATQVRAIKANELWTKVSYFRNLGRKLWAEKNEAYSNDYIMHDSFRPEVPEPEPPVDETDEVDDL